MKLPLRCTALLIITLAPLGLLTLKADQTGPGYPKVLMQANSTGLTAADDERDAREIADRINEALNLHQEVTVTLLNDTTVVVTGRVTTQRYWLIITAPDRSEFRFRAALVASVKIK